MNDRVEVFNNILNKYKFTDSVPVQVRDHVYSTKKSSLKKILKQVNDYSILFLIVIYIYFIFKNLGINASLFVCKIMLIGAIIAAAIPVSYTTYRYAAQKKHRVTTNIVTEIKTEQKKTDIKKSANKKAIVFSDIECSGADPALCNSLSEKIYKILLSDAGEKFQVLRYSSMNQKTSYIRLIGRMYRLGEKSLLTIKIIDSSDSRVKFSETINFNKNDNVDDKISVLTQSVIKTVVHSN